MCAKVTREMTAAGWGGGGGGNDFVLGKSKNMGEQKVSEQTDCHDYASVISNNDTCILRR